MRGCHSTPSYHLHQKMPIYYNWGTVQNWNKQVFQHKMIWDCCKKYIMYLLRILMLKDKYLWHIFLLPDLLDWTSDGCLAGWSVPWVPLCTQRLSSEASGLFDLQRYWDCWDNQHDRVIAVHSHAKRRQEQTGQQTGEQLMVEKDPELPAAQL